MKIFLSILIFLFASCKEKYGNVVREIGKVNKDSCWYIVDEYWERDNKFCCSINIIDTCGKYKVGDKIKF